MSNRKSIKQQITEAVLSEIPRQYTDDHTLPIDDVIFKWWQTGRSDGMRLSVDGMLSFQLAEIEYYQCEFIQEGQSWHSFLVDLNKKIKCPYYLGFDKQTKKSYIRFYDSKIAMLVALYGSLQEYLMSIKIRE